VNIIPWDGKVISKPGAYANLPLARYHGNIAAGPSISSSGLRTIFNSSPAHYYATSYLNPDAEPRAESEALTIGSAVHHLLLGETHFNSRFVVRPPEWDSWRTTAAKTWRETMIGAGMSVLLPNDIFMIRDMAKSMERHPLVRAGVLNGAVEISLIWKDEETGIWLKSRPDCCPASSGDVVDLKTTVSVSRNAIERTIADYGYHVQGALVGMASRAVLGIPMTSFSLVFIEKTPPYCVRVVTLKDVDLLLGERIIRASLRTFADCLAKGTWNGPGDQNDASYVEINPWERKRIEDRVSLMEQGILE